VPDVHFDLDRHISRVALPSPGTADQFDVLISEFLSRPLVRTRPLWQLVIVEGLETGGSPRRSRCITRWPMACPGPKPSPVSSTFRRGTRTGPQSGRRVKRTGRVEFDVVRARRSSSIARRAGARRERRDVVADPSVRRRTHGRARGAVAGSKANDAQPALDLRSAPYVVQRARRGGEGVSPYAHSLADAKRAAKYHGASVTDFVVATVSGALRRLLAARGEEIPRDLIAFVPINVRGDGDAAAMGNQISGMLVALHTDIDDPVERLRAIAQDSAKTVGVQRHNSAKMFQEIRAFSSHRVVARGKMFDAFGLFDRLPPMANLMLSSVPGPPIPLWLSGHRVVSAAPVGPLLGPFSLNVTVLGFEQNLEFGMLACAQTMPDLATLRDYLKEEASRLIDTAV